MTIEGAFLQEGEYGAEITRRAIYAILRRNTTVGSVAGGPLAGLDLQITAGSGLHIVVAPGEVIVPGSSTATQSGYYWRNSTSETLVIPAANASLPRIERVVARVKDKAYTGSENTFTLEVIEGTATAGATLANLNGVAAAPVSSYTLGYVLVPATASSLESADIKNVSEAVSLGITPLRVINATELLSGDLAEVTSGTVTLPVPTRGAFLGVFNAASSGEVTVNASTHGGTIYGGFTVGAASVGLLAYQGLLLLGDGSNWMIVAGEPKRTQTYGAEVERTMGTEYEPSATRPVQVQLNFSAVYNHNYRLWVGGVEVQQVGGPAKPAEASQEVLMGLSFICNPTQKWKLVASAGTPHVWSSYLIL